MAPRDGSPQPAKSFVDGGKHGEDCALRLDGLKHQESEPAIYVALPGVLGSLAWDAQHPSLGPAANEWKLDATPPRSAALAARSSTRPAPDGRPELRRGVLDLHHRCPKAKGQNCLLDAASNSRIYKRSPPTKLR